MNKQTLEKLNIEMKLYDYPDKSETRPQEIGTLIAENYLRTNLIKHQNNTILPNLFKLQYFYFLQIFTQQLNKSSTMISRLFIIILVLLGSNEVFGFTHAVETPFEKIPEYVAKEMSDIQAVKVLNTVYRRYASYSTIAMKIDITIQDGDYSYKKSGKTFVKGNKYRLETSDEDIVSDGKNLWVYLKGDQSLQITNASNNNQNFFCYPASLLQKYQKYCAVEFKGTKANEYVVQFTSYNDDCPYEKITVRIDKATYTIKSIAAFTSSDMGYTINIKSTRKNLNIKNSKFSFNEKKVKPSKIRDLRTTKK